MESLNINDAVRQLILVATEVNGIVDTDGWKPTYSIDEQSSLCSISTERSEYTDEEMEKVFKQLRITTPPDDVYHTVSSHEGYDITLFYDLSEIILFIQPHEEYNSKWSNASTQAYQHFEFSMQVVLL